MTDHPANAWQNALVAVFPDCRSTTPSAHLPVSDVLLQILCPTPEVITRIEHIRAATTKAGRDALKGDLPAATFAADLHHRQGGTPWSDKFISWSGLAPMDVDDLADPAAVRESLRGDPFVAAAFLSPSATGVKVLVRIADPECYADCWRAAATYFGAVHGLKVDPAPKNPASLCYLSHDPDLWITEGAVEAFQPMAVEATAVTAASAPASGPDGPLRPGEDFNRRGDLPALLRHHGWTLVRDGANQFWRRPGKDSGQSATFNGTVFYVFSSNAPPFQAGTGYCPFAVLAMLEYGGDFSAAAGQLRRHGFGDPAPSEGADVDLSGLLGPAATNVLQFDLQRFSETPERQIDWLWPGVIPRGMLSLIGGKQGLGKSFLICDLAARISAGLPMPDGLIHPPGQVLLLAREDDASCVLLPRLKVAKADLSRVAWSIFANAVTGSPIDLASHIDLLVEAVTNHRFDLIVVDTFAAFAPVGTDANAAQDVRLLLDSLTRLARTTGAAVVVVAHLRKTGQGDGDPMDAIAGSAQMTAGVRVAALLDKGVAEGERWFRVVKSNLGRIDEQGWTWRFAWPDPFTEGAADMPHIEWTAAGDEYRGLGDGPREAPLDPAAVREALLDVLAKGPRSQRAACELTLATIRRANPKVRKTDVELAVEDLLESKSAAIETWEGPRGAKVIGLTGGRSAMETPEEKAFRLAVDDPNQSADALRALAGCRKVTALEALNHARGVTK